MSAQLSCKCGGHVPSGAHTHGAGPGLAGVMVMKDHLSYKHGTWKGLEVEQRDPGGQERKETLGTCVFLTMVLPPA